MTTHLSAARSQAGVMLLEALIAILIFSIGILGIVALQGTAVKLVADAKYRSDAGQLANDLIGQMWVNSNRANAAGVPANLLATFGHATSGGVCAAPAASYDCWLANVQSTLPGIPLVADTTVACPAGVPVIPDNTPTVCVETNAAAGNPAGSDFGLVTITIYWASPAEAAGGIRHAYVAQAQIK
jgi:type IV pilus assembly protein PilV